MKKPSSTISELVTGRVSSGAISGMNLTGEVEEEIFGRLADGRDVKIFTLENSNGLKARLMEYGAILVSMECPDATGELADLTHGYDTLAGWLEDTNYFGATVGRFANRIRDGKFTLDGIQYTLAKNNEPGGIPCHLHGGLKGFDKVLWSGVAVDGNRVEFSYVSKAGDEGYPGTLRVKVSYTLTEDNELIWEAEATTDAPTIVNLVNHTYWNLSGDPTTTILDHVLTIPAPGYLPTDAGLIPTGEIAPVAGTPLDFTKPTVIGERVDEDFEALNHGCGYDHCWVRGEVRGIHLAARVEDPKSGRVMEVLTDQPGMQFYAGNFIETSVPGKNGVGYAKRSALCLETEGFPDAPNQPSFPSCVLRPGETYRHVMIHRFSTEQSPS